MSKMNQQKIANIAGVSVSTVSKAFSGSKEISDSTRQKIFHIAREYDCLDKYYTSSYENKVIIVLVPEYETNIYSKGIEYLEQKIQKEGYFMILSVYNYSITKLHSLLNYFSKIIKADGIIILGSTPQINDFDGNVPIIVVSFVQNDPYPMPNTDYLFSDTYQAMDNAVKYLYDMGHRDIAFIGELLTRSKCDCFKALMKKYGLKVNDNFLFISNYRFEDAGYNEMEKIFSMKKRPTAIMTAYDTIAYGAIDSIYDHNMSVPEDFSIIGMDNIKNNKYRNIELTTIGLNNNVMFDTAFDLLKKRMNNSVSAKRSITFYSELILRNSVKDINKKISL